MNLFVTYLFTLILFLNGPLNREEWAAQKDGMEFIEAPPDVPDNEIISNKILAAGVWIQILKYAAVILLTAILIFIIFRLVSRTRFSGAKKGSQIEEIETDDEGPNVLSSLEELWEAYHAAKNEGDFREAIRILHQIVIKHLDRLGRVKAGVEKTNREYTRELDWKEKASEFFQLTLLHEFIWYGSREVDVETYDSAEPKFLGFIHDLENG